MSSFIVLIITLKQLSQNYKKDTLRSNDLLGLLPVLFANVTRKIPRKHFHAIRRYMRAIWEVSRQTIWKNRGIYACIFSGQSCILANMAPETDVGETFLPFGHMNQGETRLCFLMKTSITNFYNSIYLFCYKS